MNLGKIDSPQQGREMFGRAVAYLDTLGALKAIEAGIAMRAAGHAPAEIEDALAISSEMLAGPRKAALDRLEAALCPRPRLAVVQ